MSNIAPSFTESPSFTKSETSKPLTLMDDMLNNPKPINLISKNTCSHQDNKCNHLKPFSMLELHGKEKFTLDEKIENLRKYKLSCSNRGGKYTQCCDKYDKNLDEVVKKLNMPELKGKVEYNRHGKLSSIKLCKGNNCPKDYKPLSTYEMCKLGQDYHKNEEDGVIKKRARRKRTSKKRLSQDDLNGISELDSKDRDQEDSLEPKAVSSETSLLKSSLSSDLPPISTKKSMDHRRSTIKKKDSSLQVLAVINSSYTNMLGRKTSGEAAQAKRQEPTLAGSGQPSWS